MKPWQRQEGETAKAYEAFSEYIKMETKERSIDSAYCKLNGHLIGTKKATTCWKNWSIDNNWVERAALYDDYLREKEREEFEEQRKKAKADRIKILAGFKGIVAQSLSGIDKELKKELEAGKSTTKISDAVQALRLLLEQERIEFDDLPTTKHELTGKDGAPIEGAITLKVVYENDPTDNPAKEAASQTD